MLGWVPAHAASAGRCLVFEKITRKRALTNHLTRILLMPTALWVAAMTAQARAELDVAKLKASIETSVEADYPKLEELYKDIHAHPELAFQEVKTAAKLAAEMRALGFEVTEKIGKTGLVAIYGNGEGPT